MIDGLKPYPATKDSGVTWLGDVPEHWKIMPALAVYRPRQIKNIGLIEKIVLSLSYGRIVVKPPEKLKGLVPESFETYQIVDPGNIIVRTTDLQNDQTSLRIGQAKDRGIITSAYMCLEAKSLVSSEFAYQYLNAYDLLKVIYAYGSGLRQNLDFRDIKRMPVLVPPLPEQAAIVRFLDHADRKIRSYIRAKQKLINLLEEQKQAIIHRAVTCGLDPNVRLKPSGVEWLGDVPENWRIVALKHVLKRLVDCEHKTAPAVEQSSYRVIRTTAVRYGQLRWSGTYCTTAEGFKAWTQRAVPEPGDVIFTREAPAGEACLVPDGAQVCLGQRTVLMKLRRDEYDSRFLVHMIYAGPPRLRIQLASQGSTVGHFNMDDIGWMKILVPPLAEQQSIVSIINQDTNSLTKAVERAEHEINLLREYRTRLIADVVTGKLDVREAAAQLHDEDQELPPIDESDEISESEEDEPDDLDVAPLEDPET